MTVILYILIAPQYHERHVLHNSRCLRRIMVRNYVRCDVDIRSEFTRVNHK